MGEGRRVAVLTTGHPPLDGRIFHKEVTSLAAAGFEVLYVARDAPGVLERTARAGVGFVPLSAAGGRWNRLRRCRQVAQILWRRRGEIDVWHIHDPELLVLCAPLRLVAGRRRIRLVYDVHEDYAAAVLTREWLPARSRRAVSAVTKVAETVLARAAALIVTATPGIAGNFGAVEGRTVVTVHNFPVTARPVSDMDGTAPPPPADGVTRCVYAGWLTALRGVREMVRAMAALGGDPIELVLAGSFDPPGLRDEVLAGAPPNVRYVGVLPWEQVPGLLATADIGMLCLHPTPNHLASMPTKLFEYLDAGLAVVASDFSEWRPYVADAGVGMQVDPTDPMAIAGAIRRLAADPAARAQMASRGRELAARCSWESEAAVLVGAYTTMLDAPA